MARRRFGAEHAVAPFDHVQVELEDAALVHDDLDHDGDRRFLRLAPPRALAREKQVLRELLRDRRAAGDDFAFAQVLLVRLADASQSKPSCSTNFASSAAMTARLRCGEIERYGTQRYCEPRVRAAPRADARDACA